MSSAIPDRKGLDTQIGEGVTVLNEPVITCKGENNRLVLEENSSMGAPGKPVKIEFLGNGNTLILEAGGYLKRGHYRFKGHDMTIRIGANTSINGAYILCMEGACVSIGKDCMLSYEIEIRTSDAHSITDAATGERLNPACDVVIDDHVWVGKGAIFMPGSRMASDSIVGTRALVTGVFEEKNVVVAGVPGRVISRGRSWDRRRL